MIPDRFEATTTIPVRIVGGRVEYFYAGPLPRLKDGAIGELRVAEHAVLDDSAVNMLQAKANVQLFPAATLLSAEIAVGSHDGVALPPEQFGFFGGFVGNAVVRIELEEPLVLTVHATKRGWLRPCRCSVPGTDIRVGSLNQAYTAISRRWEPKRKSAGGNVFRKVHYYSHRSRTQDIWEPIERRRFAKECEFAAQVFGEQTAHPASGDTGA